MAAGLGQGKSCWQQRKGIELRVNFYRLGAAPSCEIGVVGYILTDIRLHNSEVRQLLQRRSGESFGLSVSSTYLGHCSLAACHDAFLTPAALTGIPLKPNPEPS